MRKTITPAISLLLLTFFTSNAFAQQAGTATLSGTVTDVTGAVVPNVQVTATLKSTGIKRLTATNDEGYFVITNLSAGVYEVLTEALGFKNSLITGIELQVGQTRNIEAVLEVGEITATLDDLLGIGSLVNTNTSIVDGVINAREIESLPLNGRNFLELALLIPGNAPAPNFDPTKTNTVLISSAGQLGRGGNITIDGADNNDDVVGGAVQNISQEAVQEFQIATNRFSAQFGRSASSVINVVTKQGTKEVHGAASAYFRDRSLLAFILIWGFGWRLGDWSNFTPLVARRPDSPALFGALAGGLVSAFFSFGGWWDVNKLAGEVRNPAHTLPRARWCTASLS